MLARANRKTLEDVLVAAQAPDPAQLNGCVYDGYNHDWLGQLPGEISGKRLHHSLLLGKAYLRLAPWLNIFASYFVLGHSKPLDE